MFVLTVLFKLVFDWIEVKVKVPSARAPVERKFGDYIRKYVKENYTNLETILEEEAMRNLYSYTFIFNI